MERKSCPNRGCSGIWTPDKRTIRRPTNRSPHTILGAKPTLQIGSIRRLLTICTILLTVGSILILVGTFYTADHFQVQSVTTRQYPSPQGFTITLTFSIHNSGLYDVDLKLLGRILSAQQEVVRNSTNPDWIIPAGNGGNYTFTMFVNSTAAATYFTPLSPQPVFDFTLVGRTAYGFLSVTLTGQRNINMTGG